jgi:hypothetical protein
MRKILLTVILLIASSDCSQASFGNLFKTKLKKEYNTQHYLPKKSFETETIGSFKKKPVPELNFSLTGNINLYLKKEDRIYYPLISDSQEYDFFKIENFSNNPILNVLDQQAKDIILRYTIQEPKFNGEILYKESLLLLQEFINSQVESFKEGHLDLVFFTGNHVYSNNQIDHFYTNITEAFDKYQIPHYEVLGANEARGERDIKKEMGDFYYLLQTKNTNFIILNNLFKEVIPDNLPYEADEQYIWLKNILAKLEKENLGEDLIIISYKEPSKNLIEFASKYNHLNLIAFIYGEAYEYKEQEWQNILFISTPSLSKYPCSYLKVNRDLDGFYSFKEINLNLPGIQELAKSKLKQF